MPVLVNVKVSGGIIVEQRRKLVKISRNMAFHLFLF
jgi:hypothetical protein